MRHNGEQAPEWFRGLHGTYAQMRRGGGGKARVGHRSSLMAPNATTVEILKTWNSQDMELYRLAQDLFKQHKETCL